MIPSSTEARARLARSRHLVPRLRAAAQGAGMDVDTFLATLPPDEARQGAQLVAYDDYLKSQDEAARLEAEAKERNRLEGELGAARQESETLRRENESLLKTVEQMQMARMQETGDRRKRHDGKARS